MMPDGMQTTLQETPRFLTTPRGVAALPANGSCCQIPPGQPGTTAAITAAAPLLTSLAPALLDGGISYAHLSAMGSGVVLIQAQRSSSGKVPMSPPSSLKPATSSAPPLWPGAPDAEAAGAAQAGPGWLTVFARCFSS